MKVSSLAFLAAFAGLSQAQAVMQHAYIFNSAGNVHWIPNMYAQLPIAYPAVYWRWGPGQAPKHCIEMATQFNFDIETVEVWDIKFADCPIPWTVCRHPDTPAANNIQAIIAQIGQLPVRTRSWTRHFFYYPQSVAPYAGTATGHDVNIFGNYGTGVVFHEALHNVDYQFAGTPAGVNQQGFYANTAEYQNIALSDSCVPDAYAKTSWREHFAVLALHAMYEENIGPIPIGTECMANGLTHLRNILRPAIKRENGQQCINRLAHSSPTCISAAHRAAGRCNGVSDYVDYGGKRKRDVDPLPAEVEGVKWLVPRAAQEFEKSLENGLSIEQATFYKELEDEYKAEQAKKTKKPKAFKA